MSTAPKTKIVAAETGTDSELPEGWAEVKLGDCFLDVRNGTTTPQNTTGKGILVSRIESVQNGRFDSNRLGWIENAPHELINTFCYRPGDIALSHINSYEHVGKTAIYENSPELL